MQTNRIELNQRDPDRGERGTFILCSVGSSGEEWRRRAYVTTVPCLIHLLDIIGLIIMSYLICRTRPLVKIHQTKSAVFLLTVFTNVFIAIIFSVTEILRVHKL